MLHKTGADRSCTSLPPELLISAVFRRHRQKVSWSETIVTGNWRRTAASMNYCSCTISCYLREFSNFRNLLSQAILNGGIKDLEQYKVRFTLAFGLDHFHNTAYFSHCGVGHVDGKFGVLRIINSRRMQR